MKRTYATWLAVIVAASFVARTAVAWLKAAPSLFPDEYIYSSISRSLATSGRPLIRGASPHFPALLEPILTAPAWLIGDVDTAYRLVQAIGALAMSLAAIPVYLLARRLGLSGRVALALSALGLLVPDLVYASFVTSEPFAYPLVLATIAAATAALARPTRRSQLLLVLFAGLATLARAQFVVLPLVFLLAVVCTGLAERRVRAAVREQTLPLVLFLVPALGLLLSGPMRVLGFYHGVLHLHLRPAAFLRWTGWDAMMLAYASGWIIVPGALLGLWLALRRPRSRAELAFGTITALAALVLLVQVGLFQTSTAGQPSPIEIKERYLFYLVPLAGLCFALYAKRGWPLRMQHLALAGGLVLLSVRVPLSGFAVYATVSASPFLFGVNWLAGELGQPSRAAVVVAGAAALLSVAAVLASKRPRLGTPLVLGLALLATGAASAGAVVFQVNNTRVVKRQTLPPDPSWVDHARIGHASLLHAWGGDPAVALQELFWNRSVTRVLLLPQARPFDIFQTQAVQIAADGTLETGGRPVDGPLVVDGSGSTVRLSGARVVKRAPTAALWVPTGRPRLSLYATGRYYDGWLAGAGTISVWPETAGRPVSGWVTMRLTGLAVGPRQTITFTLPGGRRVSLRFRHGTRRELRLAACADGPWHATFRSSRLSLLGPRIVSVRATAPVFTPSSAACGNAPPRRSVD